MAQHLYKGNWPQVFLCVLCDFLPTDVLAKYEIALAKYDIYSPGLI